MLDKKSKLISYWIVGIIVIPIVLVCYVTLINYIFSILFNANVLKEALIQGYCTLVTGVCAIFAGYLAYQGAQAQISSQKQAEEEKRKARLVSYSLMVKEIINSFVKEIKAYPHLLDVEGKNDYGWEHSLEDYPTFDIPDELKVNNWENLSILDANKIKLIYRAVDLMEKTNLYVDYNKTYTKLHQTTGEEKEKHRQKHTEHISTHVESQIYNMTHEEYCHNLHEALNIFENLLNDLRNMDQPKD